MNLLKFLQYYNSYNNIGGKDARLNLFEAFKNGWIFHQNEIDTVIAFLRNSTLEEAYSLIDEDACNDSVSNKTDLVRSIIERSWLMLQLEKKMEGLSEYNYNDPEFARLLFGEPSIEEMEEMILSDDEEDLDEEDLAEDEDNEDESENENDESEESDEEGDDE